MIKMKRFTVGLMGMAVLAGLVGGCATQGYQKAERSAISMKDTKSEIQNAFGQVTTVIHSLDKVMNATVGDLRPMFKDFSSNVTTLEFAAEMARERALSMQTKTRNYFAAWAQEIESIQNPSIKSQSLQRYNSAKASYAKIEQTLFRTRDAYIPLISSLNDLKTAMNQDLTSSGVSASRAPYLKARQQGIALQSVLKESSAAIDEASRQLTPLASGPRQ
jgi:hypothetical protein